MPGLPPGHGREARRKRRGRIGVIGRRTHADSGLRGSRSPMRWKCVTASGRLIRRWDLHRRGSFSRVVARVLAGTISQAHSARAPRITLSHKPERNEPPVPARSPSPDTAKPNSSATSAFPPVDVKKSSSTRLRLGRACAVRLLLWFTPGRVRLRGRIRSARLSSRYSLAADAGPLP